LSLRTPIRGATPAEIWGYPERTLTQVKFPFWSAIITQVQVSPTCAGGATTYIDIRPPAGETWLVYADWYIRCDICSSVDQVAMFYYDYDGRTVRLHRVTYGLSAGANGIYGVNHVLKVLTNTLWGRLGIYTAYTYTCYAGYSGFKLSRPLWSPTTPQATSLPWKKPTTQPIPPILAPLRRYVYDILGADPARPEEYAQAVILEEDTPLAIDPDTGQPVVLQTIVIKADTLANMIMRFRTGELDPVKMGYKKYLDKWELEGIRLL
jgi:hypothetical protein